MTVEYVADQHSDEEVLSLLRPYVAEWFRRRFRRLTPPQRMAIPEIKRGNNVLVSSPTGTGKTLSVFLGLLDELYSRGERGELADGIYVVYVSPLRALNNDMHRNLLTPIREIAEVGRELGVDVPEVRVAVRTSDTPQYQKQKMLKTPPHILITTPESLGIALSAPKFREKLETVEWVVVDEIHELCSSKRGVHLSLSLERLENISRNKLKRIGLSATIAPLEEVARYLVGYEDDKPRPCKIVDARFAKPYDIRVIVPTRDIVSAPASALTEAIYKTIASTVKDYRTTLIFTNTRSATERVVYRLRSMMKNNSIIDADLIEAHHSSLSRDVRLSVEEKLKSGKLRIVACSTSLELGVDIGFIDAVVLLSSPKSVSRLLQRVGRSGHTLTRTSIGLMIAVDRDDLVECAVLAKAAMDRKIDRVRIPRNALDVLAQHVVGMALERKWRVEEAYRLVRRSYCYRNLPFEDFMRVLRYLAGEYHELRDHKVYGKIWLSEEDGVFGRRGRGKTRMIYYMNSGTIPDEAKVKVVTQDRRYIGELEEQFLQILTPGDIFVLGGRTYEFLRSRGARAIVRSAEGQRPTVPTWFSEMLPLSFDSALLVGRFRRDVHERLKREGRDSTVEWVMGEYRLERHAAEAIVDYVTEQSMFTGGIVPSDVLVMVELYQEPTRTNIIFHTLYGRRVNDALSRGYAIVLSRMLKENVRVTISDNGFMLTTPRVERVDLGSLVNSVTADNLESLLKRSLRNTELLKRKFRHCAVRSFMILRRYMDYEKTAHKLQINAQSILRVIRGWEDFPVLKETYREILEDHMDLHNAVKVLEWIENDMVKVEYFGPTDVPSPFAHHLVVQGYSDIVLMEDRRIMLQKLYRLVRERIGAYKR